MRTAKICVGLTRGQGMTEPVRLLWVLSGRKCAEIHEATQNFLDQSLRQVSNMLNWVPHKKGEILFIDLVKIIQWLLTFNPFVLINSNLRSFQSGLNSSREKDGVNRENAETITANMQTKLENKTFNISFKRSNCYYFGGIAKSVKWKGFY